MGISSHAVSGDAPFLVTNRHGDREHSLSHHSSTAASSAPSTVAPLPPFLGHPAAHPAVGPSSRHARAKGVASLPLVLTTEERAPAALLPSVVPPPPLRDASSQYSDRFIPSRHASEAFALSRLGVGEGGAAAVDLLSLPLPGSLQPQQSLAGQAGSRAPAGEGASGAGAPDGSGLSSGLSLRGREDAAAAYALLLRTELLSSHPAAEGTRVGRGAEGWGGAGGLMGNETGERGDAARDGGGAEGEADSTSSGEMAWSSVASEQGRERRVLPSSRLSSREGGLASSLSNSLGSSRNSLWSTGSSGSSNLFRFMENSSARLGPGLPPPLSLSPVGLDASLTQSPAGPRKAPRKIARSPFKVQPGRE